MKSKPKDKEATESCLQAISTHLKITIDISRNYLEDEDTSFANGIVPITGVISGHHSLVAMLRQRELGHAITAEDSDGLYVLKRSLEKKNNLWGLAGASFPCCYLTSGSTRNTDVRLDLYIQDLTGLIL